MIAAAHFPLRNEPANSEFERPRAHSYNDYRSLVAMGNLAVVSRMT